ncbi:MAG TPA: hypothetical protein VHZ31_07795 [Solirubrobacteraceae bacterium]|jgi:hypothetical protein|nr:hypothetical protein [Solirubrobacteraceae bacterium]
MDSPDEDRAIDRFVAGMPVDLDELSRAVSARAVDATIVVEALLRGLAHESADVRARTTKRAGELVELPPRLEARLRQLALADAIRRVREGAVAALGAHDIDHDSAAVKVRRVPRFAALRLVPRTMPGAVQGTELVEVVLQFRARDREQAPGLRGKLVREGGELRIELERLPEAYVGQRLAVFARIGDSKDETQVAVANEPVSPTGDASLPVAPGLGSVEQITALLDTAFDVAVVEPGGDDG